MNTIYHLELVEFDKQLAQDWLDKYNTKNRKLRPWQVKFLAEEMRSGRWSATVTAAVAGLNGDDNTNVLVNGQHTLHAIVEADVTVKLPVHWHDVSSLRELASLFAHYDIGMKRTFSDAVMYYGVDKELDMQPGLINKLAGALRWLGSGFGTKTQIAATTGFSNEDIIDWIYKWSPAWAKYRDSISPCPTKIRNRLETRVIAAVGILTMQYCPEEAFAFWRQSAKDDRLAANDPRKALHDKLIEYSAYTQTSVGLYTYVTQTEVTAIACWAWEKYYQSKKIRLIRPSKRMLKNPYVTGTPLDNPDYNHSSLMELMNLSLD